MTVLPAFLPPVVAVSPLSDLTPDQRTLFDRLATLDISHTTYDHPPVFTVAESNFLQEIIPGTHGRSLLLTNKTGGVWLVSAADATKIDLKYLSDQLATPRFSFAKPDRMTDLLHVTPGSLTPLAVLFDTQCVVTVIIDAYLATQTQCVFHPLHNTQSTLLAVPDLLRFLTATGHKPHILPLSPAGTVPA